MTHPVIIALALADLASARAPHFDVITLQPGDYFYSDNDDTPPSGGSAPALPAGMIL